MKRSMGQPGGRFDPRGHRYVTGSAWVSAGPPKDKGGQAGGAKSTLARASKTLTDGLAKTWETAASWGARHTMLLVGIAALGAGVLLGTLIERQSRRTG